METLQKPRRETFEQAQQEVVQVQNTRPSDTGGAVSSSTSPTGQRGPCHNFGNFDRHYRKHVEPRRRATAGSPGNPGVGGNPAKLDHLRGTRIGLQDDMTDRPLRSTDS